MLYLACLRVMPHMFRIRASLLCMGLLLVFLLRVRLFHASAWIPTSAWFMLPHGVCFQVVHAFAWILISGYLTIWHRNDLALNDLARTIWHQKGITIWHRTIWHFRFKYVAFVTLGLENLMQKPV